jgi:nitroreductase
MSIFALSPDELLSTTRAVRKRLDLTRPVERELIEDCLRLAQQAPTASNQQHWGFLVVTEPNTRAQLADLYRRGWDAVVSNPASAINTQIGEPALRSTTERVRSSAAYLAEHLQDVPVHVIPCVIGRPERLPLAGQAALWGSILPAAWSFMLAARSRGLGTCWTTLHLTAEDEAARLLGIPYESVTQTALIAVAHIQGKDFKPAPRQSIESMIRWEHW